MRTFSPTSEVLAAYVLAHWRETGLPSTVREIMVEFGLSSSSVARYHLDKAAVAGLVRWTPEISRSILPANWREYLKEA